jgi:multiple sugar transport system substrate-binding protein
MMMMKWTTRLAGGAMIAATLAGCAGGKSDVQPAKQAEQEPLKPVELKMYQQQPLLTEDDFRLLISEPVKKKYPHITVTLEKGTNNLEKAITAGDAIDLIAMWNGDMPSFSDLGLFEDMTPLAAKHKFDLKRFDQGALDTVKGISAKGELYGLPYSQQLNALYYNKDVFDRFGVAYPQDGLTWEDTIETGRKLTRMDGAIQYRGMDPDHLVRLLFPLSLNLVDYKTSRSVVAGNDDYRKAFETGKAIYSIQGNMPSNLKQSAINAFIKEKNVGMIATINIFDRIKQAPDLNWDLAQFPSYKGKPNMYGMYDLHVLNISKISKHKDDAMRVLEVLFSQEVQLISSKATGRLPVLQDPVYREAFGKDMPHLQGKRIQSIFKSKAAPSPAFAPYYTKSIDLARNAFIDYVQNKTDLNTALRTLDEQINQHIEANKK